MVNDKYFYDNGYWKIGAEGITEVTQKWNKLMQIVFSQIDMRKELIEPQLLQDAIDGKIEYQAPKYVKPLVPQYKKKERPEGYLTIKERKAKKAADKEARKAREVKYGRNVYVNKQPK